MKNHIRTSKFLSLVLRHQPGKIGLNLNSNGWAEVDELLEKLPFELDFQTLKEIVDTSDKQRYAFSPDFKKIRANQGHSVRVDLNLTPVEPPEVLFHGTATRNLESIKATGLNKGNRHHVHLSLNEETAVRVGGRHGKAVVLRVLASKMHQAGHSFFCSENGVWLTEEVPVRYIIF